MCINHGTHHHISHRFVAALSTQSCLIPARFRSCVFFYLQHRRTPILGDDVYGNKDWNRRLQQSTGLTRPLLHAHSLEFKHPSTGELISVVAPLPVDIEAVVRRIYPQVRSRKRGIFNEVGRAEGLACMWPELLTWQV